MRVTSGRYRSQRLYTLDGKTTRPTLDKVKQAVFNHLVDLHDCVFLDLFAGSGAIGIEALSRGAIKVIFNDKLPEAIKVVKANLAKLKVNTNSYEIYALSYDELLNRSNEKFDYIYLDPPFENAHIADCLRIIAQRQLLKIKGKIIVENEINTVFDAGDWRIYKQAKYGSIKISYLKYNEE